MEAIVISKNMHIHYSPLTVVRVVVCLLAAAFGLLGGSFGVTHS